MAAPPLLLGRGGLTEHTVQPHRRLLSARCQPAPGASTDLPRTRGALRSTGHPSSSRLQCPAHPPATTWRPGHTPLRTAVQALYFHPQVLTRAPSLQLPATSPALRTWSPCPGSPGRAPSRSLPSSLGRSPSPCPPSPALNAPVKSLLVFFGWEAVSWAFGTHGYPTPTARPCLPEPTAGGDTDVVSGTCAAGCGEGVGGGAMGATVEAGRLVKVT